jgi:Na+-translocating ferredoxin:NAD+ oxidoreductase RnfG subunit
MSSFLFSKGVSLEKLFKASFSPAATIGQKIITLNAREVQALQQKAKAKFDSNKIRFYVVKNDSKLVGYGVLVTQRVRTKKASILYMISKEAKIKSIEIIQFQEPSEYKPNKNWKDIFTGKSKENDLFVGKGIPSISGATMSARAVSDASRLALSIVEMYR